MHLRVLPARCSFRQIISVNTILRPVNTELFQELYVTKRKPQHIVAAAVSQRQSDVGLRLRVW